MQIKLIRSIFQVFLIAVICSALLACANNKHITQENTFFLSDVNIEYPLCLSADYSERELACHRLERGNRIAVAVREYDNKPHWQTFKKLTVFLPKNTKAGDKFHLPQDDIVIFYSLGLSFGPGKSGCFGVVEKGEVEVVSKDEYTIAIRLIGNPTMKRSLNLRDDCNLVQLDKLISAHYKKYEDLSPWDGKINKGASLTEETYPHAEIEKK